MKIIGFAGSNSLDSINKKLVRYVVSLFKSTDVSILDLNDFEVALFRKDREEESGIPSKIKKFANELASADLIVVSLAENNGSYNAAFKNIYDWNSRIPNHKMFQDKPVLLMATSPGQRGGKSVLEDAENHFPRQGANLMGVFSLPNFNDNFDEEQMKVVDSDKNAELQALIQKIESDNSF